jgi:hypothetical protein
VIVNRTRIPTDQLLPLIRWVLTYMGEAANKANMLLTYRKRNGSISGVARKMAFSGGRRTRGLPAGEPLVEIHIGTTWDLLKCYPRTETYKKRAGSMSYANWQEHFVALLAHEFRHIDQYAAHADRKAMKQIFNNSLEVDAERYAMRVLAKYKEEPIEEALSNAAKRESKTCPRCGKSGDIGSMFGYRTIKGKSVISQSYCHECRRAHARERRGV